MGEGADQQRYAALVLHADLAVRPYMSSDARATLGVFRSAVRSTAGQCYDQTQVAAWVSGASDDVVAWSADRAQAWTVVAELDGRVVGFGDLAEGGLLDMLFVHPDAGGRGVARALVAAVLNQARELGISRVVTHASRAARPAFEKFGFVVDRENPENLVRGVRVPNYDMHIDM